MRLYVQVKCRGMVVTCVTSPSVTKGTVGRVGVFKARVVGLRCINLFLVN